MNWYRNLFTGKTFEGKTVKVRHMVEKNKMVPDLYLIILRPETSANQLEVIQQKFFDKDFSAYKSCIVLGMADGMSEVKDILVQITDLVYSKTGTANLKDYFLKDCRIALFV